MKKKVGHSKKFLILRYKKVKSSEKLRKQKNVQNPVELSIRLFYTFCNRCKAN